MSENSDQAQQQEQSVGWLRAGANLWNSLKNNATAAWVIDTVTQNADFLAAQVESSCPTAGKIIAALPAVNTAANFLGSGLNVAANASEGNLVSRATAGEVVSLAGQTAGLFEEQLGEDLGEGLESLQDFVAGEQEEQGQDVPQQDQQQQVGWLRSAANLFDGVKEKLGGGAMEWALNKIDENSASIASAVSSFSPVAGAAIASVPYVKAGASFLMSGASVAADYQEGNIKNPEFAANVMNMGAQAAKVTGLDGVKSVLEQGAEAVGPLTNIASNVKAFGTSVRDKLFGSGSGNGAGGQGVQQDATQAVEAAPAAQVSGPVTVRDTMPRQGPARPAAPAPRQGIGT